MSDQANELRELVRRKADRVRGDVRREARFLVVSGGRDGVGTTTIALGLAGAASQLGCRVLLVDADAKRGDVASLCRLEPRYTLDDVLAARCSIGEAIQPTAAGIWVLPGGCCGSRNGCEGPCTPGQFQTRLTQPLRTLGDRYDLVVTDAGNGVNRETAQLWQSADAVLLLSTTELPAIMDAYATLKYTRAEQCAASVYCLVNMAEDEQIALDVHARLQRSCRRFLRLRLTDVGYLPYEREAAGLISAGQALAGCWERSVMEEKLAAIVRLLIKPPRGITCCAG